MGREPWSWPWPVNQNHPHPNPSLCPQPRAGGDGKGQRTRLRRPKWVVSLLPGDLVGGERGEPHGGREARQGPQAEEGKGRGRHAMGASTRQHTTSAEMADGCGLPTGTRAGRGPGKAASRSSRSRNYEDSWGTPPWLPTRQEESTPQLSPRALNATRLRTATWSLEE